MDRIENSPDQRNLAQSWSTLRKKLQPYYPIIMYVVRRFGVYIVTVLGAVTLAFIFFHSMPGDPLAMIFSALEKENIGRVTGEQMLLWPIRRCSDSISRSSSSISFFFGMSSCGGLTWDHRS
jgi:hypothetical protein